MFAVKTGTTLFPVGLSWKYAWEAAPFFSIYGEDGFHPGINSSVLAALTVYGVLFDKKDLDFIQHNKASRKNRIDKTKLSVLVRRH